MPVAALVAVVAATLIATTPAAEARPSVARHTSLERRVLVVERRVERRLGRLEARVAAVEGLPAARLSATRARRDGRAAPSALGRRLNRLERGTERRLRRLERKVAKLGQGGKPTRCRIASRFASAPTTIPQIWRRARLLEHRVDRRFEQLVPRAEALEEEATEPPLPEPSVPEDPPESPGEDASGSSCDPLALSLGFEEAGESIAGDASGYGNVARLLNGADWGEGRIGGGLTLDGVDDVAAVADSRNLQTFRQAFTVSAWVRPSASTSGWKSVASRQRTTTPDDQFFLSFYGNEPRFGLNTVNGGNQFVGAGTVPVNEWIHMAGTYDGATMRLYLNGVERASRTKMGLIVASVRPILVGGNANGGDPLAATETLAGRIDEVRIYAQALSAAEVSSLADLGEELPIPVPLPTITPTPTPTPTITPTPTPTPTITPTPTPTPQNGAVRLKVGDNFQRVVDANPPGTHFVIASGVHRMQKVNPKDGMTFTGESGTVMSGAKVLTSFTPDGVTWAATGQTQHGSVWNCTWAPGCMLPGYERDNYPEELFIDGVPMRHVASKAAVASGKWFFDYAAAKIYIGNNPTGKLVETSVTDFAFYGTASDVVIDNLSVRHYANPTKDGAISALNTLNWTIRHVDASYNHSYGISAGPGTHLHNSKLTYNGQLGLEGYDGTALAPIVIEDNEIAYNRRLGYNWSWEGGGSKILESTGTIFRNNWVHHNAGPGIWFDGYNYDTTIVSNLVEHNTYAGIFYEISYGPTEIYWNTVRHNGTGVVGPAAAGILISNSREVEVFGNAVDSNERGILLRQEDRETGPDGLLALVNVEVRNNDIRMLTGTTGLIDETPTRTTYYTSKGNVFVGNTYRHNQTAAQFSWTGRWSSNNWWQWQGFGNDLSGTLTGPEALPQLPDGATGFHAGAYGPPQP